MKNIVDLTERNIFHTYSRFPLTLKKGKGAVVWDEEDRQYIDFVAGIAVCNLGHCHPSVVKAARDQLDRLIHVSNLFYTEPQVKLSEMLKDNSFADKIFFCNSGAEANEAMMKLVKYGTGRKRCRAFYHAFHGRSQAVLSLTASKWVQQDRFFPTMPGVEHIPYPNPYRNPWHIDGYAEPDELVNRVIEFIEEYVFRHVPPHEVGAIVFEPIQGEGGYVIPPKNFFRELKKLLDKYGILFVDDEIQSGFWRSGKPFAIEHYNVVPDIITVAKSIANGVPLSAAISKSELDFDTKGVHSSTFGGNALALAAAIANIEYFEREKIGERVTKLGKQALSILNEFKEETEIVGDVRGKGLMIGVEIVKNKDSKEYATKIRDKICNEALKRGLILLPAGKSALRIAPPLTIREQIFDKGLEILMSIISDIEKGKI